MPPTESLHPVPQSDHLPVREIEGFEILQFLGEGSFGRVWKVRDLSNGKTVAVKFFTHGAGERLQVLLEEVQQHAQLDGVHGIVDLKKVVTRANPPYYVMGFADRGSLATRLEAGAIPFADAVGLFTQAAEALAYVHAKGICHCDLKPGNILLDARGRALLADFGQAHLSMDGSAALGTFFYMPPEQANLADSAPDPRWDVYGLGAVVYAALTGKPPRFDAKMLEELQGMQDLSTRLAHYRNWLAANPAPVEHRRVAGMDAGLANILDRCLHTDPARRPARRRRPAGPAPATNQAPPAAADAVAGHDGLAPRRGHHDAVRRSQQERRHRRLPARADPAATRQRRHQRQHRRPGGAVAIARPAATRGNNINGGNGQRPSPKESPRLEGMLRRLMSSDGRPSSRFAETTVTNGKGELVGDGAAAIAGEGRPRLKLTPINLRTRRSRYPHYSWRDWYSGQGDRYEEAHLFHPPITGRTSPIPTCRRCDPDDLFISISTPLRDTANPSQARWRAGGGRAPGRFQPLAAAGADRPARLRRAARPPPLLRAARQTRRFGRSSASGRSGFFRLARKQRLFPDDVGAVESYHDPVLDRDFMAGYARMTDPRIGWVALVQHDRTEMLAPIATLSEQLDWIGVQSFLLVGLVTSGLWGWLFWMLRRSERLAEG